MSKKWNWLTSRPALYALAIVLVLFAGVSSLALVYALGAALHDQGQIWLGLAVRCVPGTAVAWAVIYSLLRD